MSRKHTVKKDNLLRKVSQIFRSDNRVSPHSDVPAQHTQDIPNNTVTNPSCSTPPSIPLPTSPSKDRMPRNILAFRTITVMLSKIQQGRAFQVSSLAARTLQRQELKISNAFSTVAVIDDEIVAVVSKPLSPDQKVDVIVSQNSINDSINDSEYPLTPSPQGRKSKFWAFFTPNYTWDPETNPRPLEIFSPVAPTISDVGAGVDLVGDETIKLYVDEHW